MPATLQSIRGKTSEIQIYLGDPEIPVEDRSPDDFFTLHYRKHNMTAKIEGIAKKAEDDGRALEALCEMCVPVFARWDLKPGGTPEQMERLNEAQERGDVEAANRILDEIKQTTDEQSPIPITKDDLVEYVPSSVLLLILTQIQESLRPNASATAS
jgi:hypothetical protein